MSAETGGEDGCPVWDGATCLCGRWLLLSWGSEGVNPGPLSSSCTSSSRGDNEILWPLVPRPRPNLLPFVRCSQTWRVTRSGWQAALGSWSHRDSAQGGGVTGWDRSSGRTRLFRRQELGAHSTQKSLEVDETAPQKSRKMLWVLGQGRQGVGRPARTFKDAKAPCNSRAF